MAIRLEEGSLVSRKTQGPSLYAVTCLPAEAPRALLGIVHGYAEHAARYAHVQAFLAERGVGSVAIDLRGHGRASGARGYVADFNEYLQDTQELSFALERVADREVVPNAPKVLFGHSNGGLVAFLAALAQPSRWAALALTGPMFALALQVPAPKQLAAKLAAKLYPRFALPSGLAGKDMTHDEARAKAYEEDPLVFKRATAGWFVAAMRAQEEAKRRAGELSMPLWISHGDADVVNSMAASRAIYERVASTRKAWVDAPGLRHEILNEPSWREHAEALASFVLQQA